MTPSSRPLKRALPEQRRRTADSTVEGNLKLLLEQRAVSDASSESDSASSLASDAPLVLLVNCLLAEAIKAKASDVHLEPFEAICRVRFRIDGVLHEIQKVPSKLTNALVSRLKIMAGLDICERRIPQDGSFKLSVGDVSGEFRMSTLPSQFGEKIVLRVMEAAGSTRDLSTIGIPRDQLKLIREAIHRPDGIVLVTGPTGSGKTTTLYSALNELSDVSVSVFTAEDPVEGTIHGVTQCQVNATVGYTFASMLRSFLRQDPDVILVGEIRDTETAEISVKAALTGHLVLSTLHTNCAVSTIPRLTDMGVAPYLLSSSLTCVVAQRLVRRICTDCREPIRLGVEVLETIGAGRELLDDPRVSCGKGCERCRGTGYSGRAPIYEVLVLDEVLRGLILRCASREALKEEARRRGMITLREAGLRLVAEGITTLEEVMGVTYREEPLEPAQSHRETPRESVDQHRPHPGLLQATDVAPAVQGLGSKLKLTTPIRV